MKYQPHPYQDMITERILETPRVGIWAGMGMGKTVATLTAISGLQLADPAPALVLAPKRPALTTWPDEIKKWDHLRHLRCSTIIGTAQERLMALIKPADIYTMNYDNLPWLYDMLKTRGKGWPFRIVVADESTRLKSFRLRQGGKRAHALAQVTHTQIDRFIELSGTPAPNGVIDLWGQLWFLDRGKRLGNTFTAFSQRWFYSVLTSDGFPLLKPHEHALDEIKNLAKDICHSFDAKDYFPIEEPIVRPLYFDLPPAVRRHYDAMQEEFFTEIAGEEFEAVNAAAKSLKCLQIATGAIYGARGNRPIQYDDWQHIHDEKIDLLRSVIEEAAGMPVLVAYHFQHDLARILKAFPGARHLDARPQTIDDWNAGRIPLLVAHPASAGHGINLQHGGNILVFWGHWWALENHDQIIERIGPMRQKQSGYDRAVMVYYLLARGTLEEEVLRRHQTKRSVQEILREAAGRGRAGRALAHA